MSPSSRRSSYADAIERVRSQHSKEIKSTHGTLECPRCGTKQVITDTPGMRRCVKCNFEFRTLT